LLRFARNDGLLLVIARERGRSTFPGCCAARRTCGVVRS
jgi:hypothetical protein